MVGDSTGQALGDARAPLSPRERDVLTVSARGANVSEVSRELGLAEADVRVALTSARDKLGAGSKLEAVVIAIRQGDIRP